MKLTKKLILAFSFIVLITIPFSGISYAAEEAKIVVSEELIKLNDLYKEGVITEEEFSQAKSLLLSIDEDDSLTKRKKKRHKLKKILKKDKKIKTTAAERKRLKDAEIAKLKEERKQRLEEIKVRNIVQTLFFIISQYLLLPSKNFTP